MSVCLSICLWVLDSSEAAAHVDLHLEKQMHEAYLNLATLQAIRDPYCQTHCLSVCLSLSLHVCLCSTKDSSEAAGVDLHPEKRMRAAYLAYEERRLPQLKAENPNLRLSQLKQMIKKDWNKAPENPLNSLRH